MTSDKLTRKEIENLLPHRDPMLLIDELIDIKKPRLSQVLFFNTVKILMR